MNHEVCLIAPNRWYSPLLEKDVDLWVHYGLSNSFPIIKCPVSKIFREYDYEFFAAFKAFRLKPDIVFTRNIPAAALCCFLGLKTICETHAPIKGVLAKLFFNLLIKSKNFLGLVTIAPILKKLILEQSLGKLKEKQVFVYPDGVDLNRFNVSVKKEKFRKKLSLEKTKFIVGYAGHLYSGRGIEILLSVAKLHLDKAFVFMGGNDDDVDIYKRKCIEDRIENAYFVGFVPNQELTKYLMSCDLLVMPYQQKVAVRGGGDTSKWMSPLKMFEYMATKVPIISSDLPALRQILNESNSYLCDPEDINQWSNAVFEVQNNAQSAQIKAKQAYQDVKKYTWEMRVQKILEEFTQ